MTRLALMKNRGYSPRQDNCLKGSSVTAPDPLPRRRLRTWLRLLRLTRHTENQLREYMRITHDSTLPRFDVMAALHRNEGPLKMSALSEMLLVSNGNASTIVNRLEKDGFVARVPVASDRRVVMVELTDAGRAHFEVAAAGHAQMVDGILDAFGHEELDQIRALLHRVNPPEQR